MSIAGLPGCCYALKQKSPNTLQYGLLFPAIFRPDNQDKGCLWGWVEWAKTCVLARQTLFLEAYFCDLESVRSGGFPGELVQALGDTSSPRNLTGLNKTEKNKWWLPSGNIESQSNKKQIC